LTPEKRSIRERCDRLRTRLKHANLHGAEAKALHAVILGMLDLLEDEL
jgi:hypothetical protein